MTDRARELGTAVARLPLREIAVVFLKLGTVGFGGPAAHIAMMEDEVVRRRGWLTRSQFLDYLGATNLIPGPNSTELAIHIGHACAGWRGLIMAGACFILPAVAIVSAIAWLYVRFGSLPEAAWLLYGVKPVVIAVVMQAIWRLGKSAVKTRSLAVLGMASVAAAAFGANEIVILVAAGFMMALVGSLRRRGPRTPRTSRCFVAPSFFASAFSAAMGVGSTAAVVAPIALGPLFLVFLKVGSILFGSGYVLLAFLERDLVDRLGWLSSSQLLDAVAVGQVTPGPVFTTATFIGYILAGPTGAAVATIGIFLPAFVFVALSGPIVPRLRRSAIAGDVLDGVNVASLALMIAVTVRLAGSALVDPISVGLAALSALLLMRFRLNVAWLVLLGAAVGLIRFSLAQGQLS
jgi:chromate transporter